MCRAITLLGHRRAEVYLAGLHDLPCLVNISVPQNIPLPVTTIDLMIHRLARITLQYICS